jgi:hypothetical protein
MRNLWERDGGKESSNKKNSNAENASDTPKDDSLDDFLNDFFRNKKQKESFLRNIKYYRGIVIEDIYKNLWIKRGQKIHQNPSVRDYKPKVFHT